jgi:hypothetical protein
MRKFFTLCFPVVAILVSLLSVQTVSAQLSLTKQTPSATIDFSAGTPAGVATTPGTAFLGSGFSPNPSIGGRLNSNAWAVTGWSDGALAFGGSITTGDYARGSTTAAVSTGGMYAYAGSPASAANPILMVQPGGSDFAPGTLTLRIQNNGNSAISQLAVSYKLYVRNDQPRANSFNFSYSSNNSSYTTVPALDYLSPEAVGVTTVVHAGDRNTTITGLNIAPGAFFYIRWSSADVSGSGARDELGLDDIVAAATYIISADASLSGLEASAGLLTPSFSASETNYTISVPNGVNSTVITPTTTDPSAKVFVNGITVTSGTASPSIPLSVGNNPIDIAVYAENSALSNTLITITRAAPATPVLNLSAPLTAFGPICINTTAGPNSFTLNGTDLDGSNISIQELPGFSFSESAGGTFTSTLSFAAGSSFSGKQIFVKFMPTAVQSYDGNIIIDGGGQSGFTVPVSGSGINTGATAVTGGSIVAGNTGTLSGSISATGCSAITAYGFEYSTTAGFANGTGIQVTANNLNAGGFSKTITGLAAATTYYYKAFATSAAGTSYGTQNSFTTSSVVPVVMSAQPLFRYTENFADIANWSNNFTTGNGANHFSSVDVNPTGTIPSATRITTATLNFSSGTSGGVQRGSGNLMLLSTGATDNTSSAAVEFYMDFTGMNAGTLSFDWASVNNSTGNRNGSLRVYGSVDGVNFVELTSANVLNFTNNVPSTGIVNNIALPSGFNNSPTARLRFYYHNGTGGSTGSRPKISIDNLTVTGVPSAPCSTPTAGATSLIFGVPAETSLTAGFTAASPAVDEYMVIMSTNNSLTSNPVDGQVYNIGDELGDGDVVAKGSSTSFSVTGLTGSTTYYFFIFPLNSVCTGGPLYAVPLVLTGDATTAAGLPPCAAPVDQATGFIAGTTGVNSIQASFTAGAGQEYLVLQSTSPSFSGTLVNGQVYTAGNVIGNAVVVQRSSNTSFTASGLVPATQYYYFIYSLNSQNCLNGPAYNTVSPLTGSQSTQPLPVCVTPSAQPANLSLNASNTTITGTFNGVANTNNYYLVVRSTSATLSVTPTDNTDYNPGDNLGGGIVVSNSGATSFSAAGLTPTTTYYFFVFAMDKNCTGGTKYLTVSPLTGSTTTTSTPPNNYYFGTLHAHSDYSDGQKDNAGGTPTQAWQYAMSSLNMDFMGISEHNHFSSLNNPGNELANYHSGVVQAVNFNAANSGFLAMYGMEWGVISGGGHVLVYGDQLGELFGWESNVNGNVGPNYDVYVPKSVYTGPDGLFKTINDYQVKKAFASLAHPDSDDFNNLSNLPYDAQADSAIAAVSVESGPANSTNTSYSNPGSSMSSLWYYQKLLSKGYHLGPTIDHDNHYTTFGRTTKSRTAVLAPVLTQTALTQAIRDMRFYATQDYDTKVDFTVNTHVMGSVFEDLNAPSISVSISDATTDHSNAVIKLMYGVPGSNVLPVELYSVTGSSLGFVDNSLPVNGTGYYYIDITNGATRTVTSPIWYTRKCAVTSAFTASACGSYTWGSTLYTTSTVDTKTFTTTSGCDSTVTMTLTITPGTVTNINTGENFCTIQAGINDPQTLNGHTLEVQSATYNEQVLVNKNLAIKGVGPSQPVINFTGTPTGKKTVVDVSKADVTLDNLNIKVDLVKLSSGIIVSGTAVSNLTLTNNKIDAYGSAATASSGSYSDRNAVSINYSGATNYRIASGGVFNVNFSGNTVTGVVNDGFGQPRYFRSGVAADETSGSFSNNTLQSINHDVLARFGNNAAISITNNIFNGGGVEFSDMITGTGALTVSGNNFNAAFANTAAANTAVLRLKNNFNFRNTIVTNNTFSDHEWAVSLENYNTVNVNNNSFTPLAGSVTYHHITMNTKTINTNSATVVQKPIDGIIRTNTFNGSGAAGGTAVTFLNHDNDAAVIGPIVLGGPGFENNFNAGIKTFIALDHQSGPSGTASFPLYPSVIGTGVNAVTTMAPWTTEIFGVNNRFDVGSGLELPSAMPTSNLFALEDRIQHKIDANTIGFVVIKAGNDYVTTNSFLPPLSTAASVQRGVNAASNGFTVNIGPGVFVDNVTVNKSVVVSGQGQAATKIIPAVSNPDCGGSGGGSICPGGSNVILVQANNVRITQLTIDGDNPAISSSTVAGGVDIDARNGIITDHNTGVFNNLNVNNVTVKNIFLRGVYASSGGTFSFENNTVDNVQGNTSSIGIFNFGGSGSFLNNTVSNTNDGIASNWSKGSTYTGNTVTNSGSGIHSDNNGGQGGTADLIAGNQVSNSKANGYGIWVFAPYVATQVNNNFVTNVDVGMAAAGQQAAVTPVFALNTIDGQNKANSTGMYVTTSLFGFGSGNVSVQFQNNFVRNNTDGFYLESEPGMTLSLQAHNNSFTGNSNSQVTGAGTGSIAANMECNWWGTTNNAAIAASIVNAPSVDYSPRLTNGTDVSPAPGFQPTPSCADPINNAQVTATTNVNCYGASTGSATIVFNNGVPPASYSLDGGAPVNIAAVPFTITGLAAGSHTAVITDASGNSVSVSFSITQPAAPLSATYSATPIACYNGLSTESVTIYGGTAPYSVHNQGGGALVLGAGEGITYNGSTYAANYTYTVTDAKGCQYVFDAQITQPDPLTANATATDILCNSGSATVTVTANGGTAPYSGTGSFNTVAGTYTYTVTDANGCTASTTVTVNQITDVIIPVITAPASITVTADAGTCSAISVTLGAPVTTDNCTVASVTNNAPAVFAVGVTTVTWTVTDNSGNIATATQTVTVVDNLAPVITAPVPAQSFCGSGGSYSLPNLGVTDNCGVSTVTYIITGATARSGTGVNASGVFNTGISTITWTVKDAAGNTSTSSATVTVTTLATPTITVSAPDAFCNRLTLTATSNASGATYKWMLGSSTVAITPQLGLGLTNADGLYTVTVTAGSCTSTPASYLYQKQNLVSSYTILTYKDAEIGKYNKVSTGSVGVMTAKGKAEFESHSSVNGPGSFVKAPKVEKNGYNISINSQINGVAAVTLPSMQYNTANTKYLPNYNAYTQNATLNGNYNMLTVKKNISITVTGNTFGTIKLEEGASIRFTNTVLNIDNFIAEKGAKDDHYSYIRFAAGTSVRVSSKVSLGSQVWLNPDNVKLTFYMGDAKSDEEKFTVSGGDTKITANIFMPDGKLKVTATDVDDDRDACDHRAHSYWSCRHKHHFHNDCDHRAHNAGDCGDDVYMTGVFIVEQLESKGNTVIWNSYDCSSSPSPIVNNTKATTSQKISGETTVTAEEEELKITAMPNPSTSYFTLKFVSKYETPLNLRVMDARGRVVDSKSNIGANSTLQIGHAYTSGTYYAEVIQEGRRKIVQLIKAR